MSIKADKAVVVRIRNRKRLLRNGSDAGNHNIDSERE